MAPWRAVPLPAKALFLLTFGLSMAAVFGVGLAVGWSIQSGVSVPLGAAMVGGSNLALALVSAPTAVAWGVVVGRTWRALEGSSLRLAPVAIWCWAVTGMIRGAYYGAARALAPPRGSSGDGGPLDLWELTALITMSRFAEAAVAVVALYPALLALGKAPSESLRFTAAAGLLGVVGNVLLVLLLL